MEAFCSIPSFACFSSVDSFEACCSRFFVVGRFQQWKHEVNIIIDPCSGGGHVLFGPWAQGNFYLSSSGICHGETALRCPSLVATFGARDEDAFVALSHNDESQPACVTLIQQLADEGIINRQPLSVVVAQCLRRRRPRCCEPLR
jgi:hypothetical protein